MARCVAEIASVPCRQESVQQQDRKTDYSESKTVTTVVRELAEAVLVDLVSETCMVRLDIRGRWISERSIFISACHGVGRSVHAKWVQHGEGGSLCQGSHPKKTEAACCACPSPAKEATPSLCIWPAQTQSSVCSCNNLLGEEWYALHHLQGLYTRLLNCNESQ